MMAATTTTPAFLTLQDRVAIVTGSSCGIGKAIAINLASLGAKLVINYTSNKEQAELVAKEIKSGCVDGIPRAVVVQADVSEPVHVKLLFDEAERVFGHRFMSLLIQLPLLIPSIRPSLTLLWRILIVFSGSLIGNLVNKTCLVNLRCRIIQFVCFCFSVNCRGTSSCCKETANQVKLGGGVE